MYKIENVDKGLAGMTASAESWEGALEGAWQLYKWTLRDVKVTNVDDDFVEAILRVEVFDE